MADDTDEITISIPESDLPPETEQVQVAPVVETPKAAEPTEDPVKAIAELKAQLSRKQEEQDRDRAALAESERRRSEAERHAATSDADVGAAQAREIEANYAAVTNSLASIKNSMVSMQSSYAAALKDGDYDKAAELQSKMSQAGAQIVNLEAGKSDLESRKAAIKNAPQPRQQPQYQFNNSSSWSNDEFDAYIRTRTPQTAAWLRSNPRFATDPSFRQQVIAADSYAQAKNIARDSAEYFRTVDELTGQRQAAPTRNDAPMSQEPPREQPQSQAAAVTARQSPGGAAPVSRSVLDSNPSKHVRISLTKEEQDIARTTLTPELIGKDKDPLVVYAQNKAAAARAGNFKTETRGGPTHVGKESIWSRQ